jgi:hypothetical protein
LVKGVRLGVIIAQKMKEERGKKRNGKQEVED